MLFRVTCKYKSNINPTMTKLELLIESVEKRLPISFQYNKRGKIEGVRTGNVHAVFIFTSKAGVQSTKADMYQTEGVSDTAGIPDWRPFNIEDITDVKILEEAGQFEVADGYNPNCDKYDKPLAKI